MGGGADLPALVDALAARWPIDVERVLVVGHSMGAGAAMAAAGRTPSRFRAVAALGGGGAVPKAAAAKELPFFVGVGERDFARAGALRLHEGMLAGGIPSTLREYAAVEHLAIVQIALPDVFAFFEGALAAK
jgi:pimeloyl-ACP methyl ester carboxylesterase